MDLADFNECDGLVWRWNDLRGHERDEVESFLTNWFYEDVRDDQ